MRISSSPSRAFARVVSVVALTFTACAASAAVSVDSLSPSPTFIGSLLAGQSYLITTTGIVDLAAGFNGGQGLTFTADGKPTYELPAPYTGFNPAGSDEDPSTASIDHGVGGPGRLLGALLGTYTAAPTGPSDYFVIGLGTTITASADGALYAVVNDTFYGDNSASGYAVTLTAVPEPEGYALMLAGLASVGVMIRRRKPS